LLVLLKKGRGEKREANGHLVYLKKKGWHGPFPLHLYAGGGGRAGEKRTRCGGVLFAHYEKRLKGDEGVFCYFIPEGKRRGRGKA